ncbi:MAG TPA: hypothetical protein VFQ26_04905, partial [Nitrospiraceae bacterium]|nr:hypothetical protein [Nitrospiraceae bacterium]
MSADPVTIHTSGPAPDALVTEAEYQAREAERPPGGGGSSYGVSVMTEEALRNALPIGGRIHVAVKGELPLTVPQMVPFAAPGTVLCGLGKTTTALAIKCENPNKVSFYAQAQNLTFEHITLDSGFFNIHALYADCSQNVNGMVVDNVRIRNAQDGVKYVGHIAYPPLIDFTFRNSDVVDFKGFGMNLDCDISNPVIENFLIRGWGKQQSFTGIWMGQGILGGRVVNGRIENVGYNGLE